MKQRLTILAIGVFYAVTEGTVLGNLISIPVAQNFISSQEAILLDHWALAEIYGSDFNSSINGTGTITDVGWQIDEVGVYNGQSFVMSYLGSFASGHGSFVGNGYLGTESLHSTGTSDFDPSGNPVFGHTGVYGDPTDFEGKGNGFGGGIKFDLTDIWDIKVSPFVFVGDPRKEHLTERLEIAPMSGTYTNTITYVQPIKTPDPSLFHRLDLTFELESKGKLYFHPPEENLLKLSFSLDNPKLPEPSTFSILACGCGLLCASKIIRRKRSA